MHNADERPLSEDIIKHEDKKLQDEALGYTLKDIADYLSVHYVTISRIVKKGVEKA